MRRTALLLVFLAVLQACATSRGRGPTRATDPPPPEKLTPAAAAAPVGKADSGIEKVYRSSLSICFDNALKVCRERDFRVINSDRQKGTISAQARGMDYTLTFAAAPEDRTRVVVKVQGRGPQENRDEAISLLNKLSDTLLEPRD